MKTILFKSIKSFAYGFLVKFLLRLASERKPGYLLYVKVTFIKRLYRSTLPNVAKFGLVTGLLTALFKLTKLLLRQTKIGFSSDVESFVAACKYERFN